MEGNELVVEGGAKGITNRLGACFVEDCGEGVKHATGGEGEGKECEGWEDTQSKEGDEVGFPLMDACVYGGIGKQAMAHNTPAQMHAISVEARLLPDPWKVQVKPRQTILVEARLLADARKVKVKAR